MDPVWSGLLGLAIVGAALGLFGYFRVRWLKRH